MAGSTSTHLPGKCALQAGQILSVPINELAQGPTQPQNKLKSVSRLSVQDTGRSRSIKYRKRCLLSEYHRRACKSQNLSKTSFGSSFPTSEDSREQLVTTASPNVFKATRHLSSTRSQLNISSSVAMCDRVRTSGCCIATRSLSLQPWWKITGVSLGRDGG